MDHPWLQGVLITEVLLYVITEAVDFPCFKEWCDNQWHFPLTQKTTVPFGCRSAPSELCTCWNVVCSYTEYTECHRSIFFFGATDWSWTFSNYKIQYYVPHIQKIIAQKRRLLTFHFAVVPYRGCYMNTKRIISKFWNIQCHYIIISLTLLISNVMCPLAPQSIIESSLCVRLQISLKWQTSHYFKSQCRHLLVLQLSWHDEIL